MHSTGWVPRRRHDPAKDTRTRIHVRWWFEWVDAGARERSKPKQHLARHGVLAAAHMLLMGREKYGIRRGSDVLIPEDGTHNRKPGVRVAQIYIDGRLVAGDELKGLLERVRQYQEKKRARSARSIAKLDADLARIR